MGHHLSHLLLLILHWSFPDHEGIGLIDVGVVVAHDVVEAAVQEVHRMRDWRAHVLLIMSRSSPLFCFKYVYLV